MKCETVTASVPAMSDPNASETCERFLEKREGGTKRDDGLMQAQRHTALQYSHH